MNIGILGGSFDPVHSGHIETARNVLKNIKDISQVWLLPALRNPFKEDGECCFEDRVEMCRRAVWNERNIYVCDAEQDISRRLHKRDLFTDEVLENLPKGNMYWFIVGTDCIPKFYMWHNYRVILDKRRLVVMSRPGFVLDMSDNRVAEVMSHPHVFYVKADTQECSSTDIRDAIRSECPVSGMIESVGNYIENSGLYKLL